MRKNTFLSCIVVLIGLAGCTKGPALKVYSFDIPQVDTIKTSPYKNKNIKVTHPYSIRGEVSQKMQFSYSSSDSGSYQNSEWSSTVGKLLHGTFVEVLDSSRIFKTELLDTSSAKENYRLESNIFAFWHSVRGSDSYAVVSIQFTLIDTQGGGYLVKSKRFSYQEPTKTIDAKGYAEATNVIIGRLSKDLLEWLR